MLLLPFVLERVLQFAIRHHVLLHTPVATLALLRQMVRGDILWTPSHRFPYFTYHYRFLQYDVYATDGFAALTVGTTTVGASTLGRWVYLYGPHRDPIVEHITYRVLACEPL